MNETRTQEIEYMYFTHLNLKRWAATRPDTSCVIEAETGRSISYQDSFAAVQRMRQKLGEKPSSIILTLPGGIIDAIVWLAALTGGHTLIPLAPDASIEERERAVRMYKPNTLIVEQRENADDFSLTGDHILTLTRDECNMLIHEAQTETNVTDLPFHEGSVCLMTSGTTGEPKGVVLQEHQIAWTAEHIRTSHQLTPDDRGLTVLPFFHVNAPVVSLCTSILEGSTVVIARKFSRTHFWEWVERYQVTWVSVVPAIVEMLLTTDKPDFLPGKVRFFRTGSSPLPATTMQAFEAKFGIPLIETYGLSEAASEVAGNPLPPGKHKPGSVGLPVSAAIRICYPRRSDKDEALRDVPEGEMGELCISGPGVIAAYQGNADKKSFQSGWFRTGDLGYQDAEGYLYITGRLREVIIRGGENIAPREVEEILQTHPVVRESAVVGRYNPTLGEEVVAFIVPRKIWNEHTAQSLHDYTAQHLSPHKVPVDFIAVDALPHNATGKIERRLLREQANHHS